MAGPAQTAEGQTVVCAWCETPLGEDRTRLGGRSVCPVCGVATTDPWPTDAELDAAYAPYRPDSGRFSGPGDWILKATRGRLARRIAAKAPPGPVLDVGAGDGTLLAALAAAGREAVGLERDGDRAGEASDRADVRAEDLTEHEGRYAAVVLWHSLEHLPRPGAAIDHAAGLLVPGGLLLVAVPNAESLQARAFGDSWLHLDLPRHLVHVGAHPLLGRMKELGLEVERVSYARGGQILFGWLHGLVGRVTGVSLYDAIRRPEARFERLGGRDRAVALAATVALLPLAAVASVAEIALRRGGTVYAEARRG